MFFLIDNTTTGGFQPGCFLSFFNPAARFLPNGGLRTLTSLVGVRL